PRPPPRPALLPYTPLFRSSRSRLPASAGGFKAALRQGAGVHLPSSRGPPHAVHQRPADAGFGVRFHDDQLDSGKVDLPQPAVQPAGRLFGPLPPAQEEKPLRPPREPGRRLVREEKRSP